MTMAPAKAVLKFEPTRETESGKPPHHFPDNQAATEPSKALVRPLETASGAVAIARSRRDNNGYSFQARIPIIIGEATFRGLMPVDGIISGQLGANGNSLAVRQRPRSGPTESQPELTGELDFKDMLRINGHIAGKVTSQKGTLIVDLSALVDGDVEVGAVVVSGTVNGDIIGHERVDLGPAAVINGNISTRTLTMKPGAVFQGDCRMLRDEDNNK
jgi:cytoskeletal protein CcmA (bactofilin family)